MSLQDIDSGFQFGEDPPWAEDEWFSVNEIFRDAQDKTGIRGDNRCPVCGGIFQRGECIECGHKITS